MEDAPQKSLMLKHSLPTKASSPTMRFGFRLNRAFGRTAQPAPL